MKYMVKPLELHCVNYLLSILDVENLFTILEFCIDCEVDNRLMVHCRFLLATETDQVLKAKSFPTISHKCLSFVLKQDFIKVPEIRLFNAVSLLDFL